MRTLSRRSILSSTPALAALLAPVLRARDARAAGSPRRVVLLFCPNGPIAATGPASGSENAFTLHDWWKPLERHKSHGIFLSHMAVTGSGVVSGDGHGLGGQILSGYGADVYANKGETIDQVIGKRLEAKGTAGVRRGLVWGSLSNGSGGGTGDAFCAGPGRNITPETDPAKAWADLFSAFMPGTASDAEKARAAQRLARQKSVLDFVGQDCLALKDALGAEGVRLLDDHCTTVRGMERNLVAAAPPSSSCTKPTNPGAKSWTSPDNCDAQMAAFVDLVAMTLACELSHVIAFQFGAQAARNRLAASYGVPTAPKADSGDSGPAHHPWTHQYDSSPEKEQALRTFTRFYSTQVARLVDRLKSTSDAAGNPLIDSTMVLCASELGGNDKSGDPHLTASLPVMVFGRGQGGFATGRYLRGKSPDAKNDGPGYKEAGRDMARLLVSAMQYMGLRDVRTVGATGVDGGLDSLHG